MTWLDYIGLGIVGWALLSLVTVGGWICACHFVWSRQRRRTQSVSARASRPVGDHAVTSSAAVDVHHVPSEGAAQGTAPTDRAPRLVPGEKRTPLRLIT